MLKGHQVDVGQEEPSLLLVWPTNECLLKLYGEDASPHLPTMVPQNNPHPASEKMCLGQDYTPSPMAVFNCVILASAHCLHQFCIICHVLILTTSIKLHGIKPKTKQLLDIAPIVTF
jgi:hypothetical protein